MSYDRIPFLAILALSLGLASGCTQLAPVANSAAEEKAVQGQVMVETKIVRASAATLVKLGIDPVTGKSGWAKLATSPDVETLAGGSIVSLSDMEGALVAVRKNYFPTDYQQLPLVEKFYPDISAPTITSKLKGKEITIKIEDTRPPLPVIGHVVLADFGEWTNLGYILKAIPKTKNKNIIHLKPSSEYFGLKTMSAPESAPVAKMPEIQLYRNTAEIELSDGAVHCLGRKRMGDGTDGDAWQFTLVTAKLMDPSGALLAGNRLDPAAIAAVPPPAYASPLRGQQIEVVCESVEIPRKALLELAAKNGFSVEDVVGNAGVLPATLAALVRRSPAGKRLDWLSGMDMPGQESVIEQTTSEYFPVDWRFAQTSGGLVPGKAVTLPMEPVFGEASAIGTNLRFTAKIRNCSIINIDLLLDKNELDGWGESFGMIEVNGQEKPLPPKQMPCFASMQISTRMEVADGATVQLARVQGKKTANSTSSAFFGADNILKPGAKLGEERDLFFFLTARIVAGNGAPTKK